MCIYYVSNLVSISSNVEDLTATEITGTSATIGWTVEYISVEQDYVVNYGTSEDNLDQTSDTVPSVTDTSLTNQEYSVSLTDLSAGTMYYYQVVATFESTTLESDTASFTTLELGTVNYTIIQSWGLIK